ncbi:hypothetical protein QBC42DRAFT_221597 [Cladorrhinum samala]|uniref:rRNA methyltransferase 1, mitochondrial n=1 Tax=Cladorrhinum samala TaxID=585594 RepID=A0AAV9HTE4_9PEZI|nr:hypothetical protein QBC42DRAFT_221597 [Cladorrhinum samala]
MALQLVYRAARPSLAASITPASLLSGTALITQSARALSLSASLQGPRTSPWVGRGKAAGENKKSYAERKKAREELAAQRPTYKIRKGKKDITEYPDEVRPQSRQSRFYNPEDPHGKRSLVYKLKTGQLSQELKMIQEKNGTIPDSLSAFMTSKGEQPRESRYSRRERERGAMRSSRGPQEPDDIAAMIRGDREFSSWDSGRGRDGGFGGVKDRAATPRRDRDFGNGQDRDSRPPRDNNTFGGSRESRPPRESNFGGARDFRPRRDGPFDASRDRDSRPPRHDHFGESREPRPPRESNFAGARDFRSPRDGAFGDSRPARDSGFGSPRDSRSQRPESLSSDRPLPARRNDPISIPYTTAASQFLYGKSVVEAALTSARRKLYKLYIHNGASRENVDDNKLIRSLAARRGVEVVTLRSEDDVRLLDKLSKSRPHNGFVLEASPLPQPPLQFLGPIPKAQEEYAAKPGFPVKLRHQSAEEKAVNGADTFVPCKSVTHRPLVVVLDRVLDPGNLGAILRTADFLGVAAVGITKHGGAKLTPVALKASAGAAESMTIFEIASLPEFLNTSRSNGWVTYATVAREPGAHAQRRHVDLYDVERADPLRTDPCVLIMGSEGEGLDRLVVKKADYELSVPNMSGSGSVDSLNVGIAAGLLCTSFLKGMTRELNGLFGDKIQGQGQEEAVGGQDAGDKSEEDLW